MNIYQVQDSGPNIALNTRYFWIEDAKIDGDWLDHHLREKVLLVSNDWKFASFKGKSYRVCEINIDEDGPFIKVWEKDPFAEHLPEHMARLPDDDEPEYTI